jgi:hypothetical protein
MIDKLISLVQQQAGDDIVKNPAIPDARNNEAIQDVAQQIVSGMKGGVSQGNVENLVSMFQGGNASVGSNPVVSQIVGNVAANFASKFGLPAATAQQIAMSLVPKVMNQLVKKTNDPNDNDFDIQDLLSKFSGGSNIQDLLGKFTGGAGSGTGVGGALGKMFGG